MPKDLLTEETTGESPSEVGTPASLGTEAAAASSKDLSSMTLESVLSALKEGTVSAEDALLRFPDEEEVICTVYSLSSIAGLINLGIIDPLAAVKDNPNNIDVILAAIKKDPNALIHASVDTVNKLGREGQISKELVMAIFKKTQPSEEEIAAIGTQFDQAIRDKNWKLVNELGNRFWFENPDRVTKEFVANLLRADKDWTSLFQLLKDSSESYPSVYGPKEKNKETIQFEEITRKLMEPGQTFEIKTIDEDEYIVFADGTHYNWTQILAQVNFQHVNFNEEDFVEYERYSATENHRSRNARTKLVPTIDPSLPAEEQLKAKAQYEDELRVKLYGEGRPIPNPPISLAEMQAINLYTGGFYESMNAVLRKDQKDADFIKSNPQHFRAAIIHSAMAASGLNKAPMVEVKTCYRGAAYGSDEQQAERIDSLARGKPIRLETFVSTTTDFDFFKSSYFSSKPVHYALSNLRGFYIQPISKNPHEQELLIPPAAVQLTSYRVDETEHGTIHYFEGSIADDLGEEYLATRLPLIVNPPLHLAKPETLAKLVLEGKVSFNDKIVMPLNKQTAEQRINYCLTKLILRGFDEDFCTKQLTRLFKDIRAEEISYLRERISENAGLITLFRLDSTATAEEQTIYLLALKSKAETEEPLFDNTSTPHSAAR